ncbi:MAG: hypothetical protein H0Z34_14720 [Brevibacillus sp.]|nr:hypothetical protein [Brevibacillus sp.]
MPKEGVFSLFPVITTHQELLLHMCREKTIDESADDASVQLLASREERRGRGGGEEGERERG